jgi:hypothetical protein
MLRKSKIASELSVEDFEAFPAWRFTTADEIEMDETVVEPVEKLPADLRCAGCIVGTHVTLAGGQRIWATLSNIDPDDPGINEQFLALSVIRNGTWFHLARYHDVDAERRGPAALAAFLGLPLEEVFPIRYDLTALCSGSSEALAGQIRDAPRTKLSQAELIALAMR